MPTTVICNSVRDATLQYMAERTRVEHLRNLCVLTLPVRTIDGRLVDVFIEQRVGDLFLVHDAGKAANELILQGVSITPSISRDCERIAKAFGGTWSDEMFQSGCKLGEISSVALSVAMCSSLAMVNLLEHVEESGEEPVHEQIGVALRNWNKRRPVKATIREHVEVAGAWKQHAFDFVAYPKGKGADPIAISVLSPSVSAISAAERFAFKAKDVEGTPVAKWKQVAVTARAETWSSPARNLVAKCSDAVIQLTSGETPTIETIAESLDALIAA